MEEKERPDLLAEPPPPKPAMVDYEVSKQTHLCILQSSTLWSECRRQTEFRTKTSLKPQSLAKREEQCLTKATTERESAHKEQPTACGNSALRDVFPANQRSQRRRRTKRHYRVMRNRGRGRRWRQDLHKLGCYRLIIRRPVIMCVLEKSELVDATRYAIPSGHTAIRRPVVFARDKDA